MLLIPIIYGPNTLSFMVQTQQNGEPDKADLSRLAKFMSDDGRDFFQMSDIFQLDIYAAF